MDHPLRFPKLKKLIIDFQIMASLTLAFLDFTSCADNLESIEIIHCGSESSYQEEHPETEYFINTFGKLRNLKCCSIFGLSGHYHLFNCIKHFEKLR